MISRINKLEFSKLAAEGIIPLFSIQVVSTLSFSVLYSTLVLYMNSKLGLSVRTANNIMGVFVAFNHGLHLLGGIFGGRLLSNRGLFCIGMVAQILGCILLSLGSINLLYYGLATFLTGSGLNVTCLNCMLTQRFSPEDTRRETIFLMNYAGMNIGFFVGFSLSGAFQLIQNYECLFLMSSLGNLIALMICLYCWDQLADKETVFTKREGFARKRAIFFGVLFVILLPFILSWMLHYADWAKKFVLITGVTMLGVILHLAKKQSTKEAKNKIVAFAALMIIGTIFWMLYQIAPMGFTVFIDYNVQRAYGNWKIPPQWFQNINTIAIAVGGPLLGVVLHKMRRKGIQVNIPSQFALALLFIGLAFVILPVGIYYADPQGFVHPCWVILSYMLQSMGELLISPIGYAMIGYLAPAPLQGVMMGMWMLNSGVGAALSSYSSNLMIAGQDDHISPLLTNNGYSHVFLMLGLFAMVSSGLLFLLIPKLQNLIRENKSIDPFEAQAMANKRVVVCE